MPKRHFLAVSVIGEMGAGGSADRRYPPCRAMASQQSALKLRT
jgi:hypothetical protein